MCMACKWSSFWFGARATHGCAQTESSCGVSRCSQTEGAHVSESDGEDIQQAATNSNSDHNLEMGMQAEHFRSEMELRLFHFAARGYYDKVKYLLELGFSGNILDYYGQSPLHLAAQHGHIAIVKLLIDQRCNINCRDNNGDTPLMIAA